MASKFQRRHYEAIAAVLRDELASKQEALFTVSEVSRLVEKFSSLFTRDNPNFDRDRFVAACGFDGK